MVKLQSDKMMAHVIFGILLFFEGLSKRDHCHHKVLYVQDITPYTATLYWKIAHTKSLVEDYKVMCAGVRQYSTVEGDKEVDLDTVTQFLPAGVSRAFLSKLQSNFNYSCVVQAESEQHGSQETRPLLFSTLYSAPEAPESPAIEYRNDDKQIDIRLFPTSTKYGPIDGYEVQFHILDKATVHEHGQPVLPSELIQPRGLLASVKTAQSSLHAIPFSIAFRNSTLPSHITLSDSLLQGAMRSGTTYVTITVAYTDNYEEISSPLLYTSSLPSKPLSLTVTSTKLHSEKQSMLTWLERQLIKFSMAVGVVTSNLILFYFLVVGCTILYVEIQRSNHETQLTDKEHTIKAAIQGQDSTKSKGLRMGREDCKVKSQIKTGNASWRREKSDSKEEVEQDSARNADVKSNEACNRSSSESGVYSIQQLQSSGRILPQPAVLSSSTTPLSSSELAMASSKSGPSVHPSETMSKDCPSTDILIHLGGGSTDDSMGNDRSSSESVVKQWQSSNSSLPQPHSTGQLVALSSTVQSSTLPPCQDLAMFTGPQESLEYEPMDRCLITDPIKLEKMPTEQENLTFSEETDSATTDSLTTCSKTNGQQVTNLLPEDKLNTKEDCRDASSTELEISLHNELLIRGEESRTLCVEGPDLEGHKNPGHLKSDLSVDHLCTQVMSSEAVNNEDVDTQLPHKEHGSFAPYSISETLKKAQNSTESQQTSVHSGWTTISKETSSIGALSCDTPNVNDIKFVEREQSLAHSNGSVTELNSYQASVFSATHQMEHCVSSLVFIPRGLSQGPCTLPSPVHGSSLTSVSASTADLAPDLEMDLYGISYSLDTSLDSSQH